MNTTKQSHSAPARFWLLVPLLLLTISCALTSPLDQSAPSAPQSDPESVELVPPQAAQPPLILPTLSPEMLAGLDAEEQLLINLYQRVNPAVVNLDIGTQSGVTGFSGLGSGSGFLIDNQGHIVTNQHVVEDGNAILVTFSDGSVAEARLLGTDPFADVAVVQVDISVDHIQPLQFGDSNELQVGQRVIAIGNPFGLTGSMTTGIISALGRTLPSNLVVEDLGSFSNPEIIQTDTAINPGNSGGPLLDSQGNVVGINTAIRSETGANSGIGFAVPANTVRRSAEQLIASGSVSYTYLGISSDNTFSLAEVAARAGLSVSEGVLISDVTPNAPAAIAGLRGGSSTVVVRGINITVGGDIITEIDGTLVRNFDELVIYLIANTEVGQEVALTVFRDGDFITVPVTLGPRPR